MEQIRTKLKKWGNSMAVVIPAKIIEGKSLKEGSEITITFDFGEKTKVKDVFGMLKGKLKKDTQELLDEVDRDFSGEDE